MNLHSGLHRPGKKGMFFYFKAEREGEQQQHFWRYYDLATGEIIDNRWVIANLIACERDTPRVVADYDVFDIQEKLIEHIIESQQAQAALEKAPSRPDALQTTVATILRDHMSRPDLSREDVIAALKFLAVPLTGVQVRELREAHRQYQQTSDAGQLLGAVLRLRGTYGANIKVRPGGTAGSIRREDLRLLCFEYICS